MLTWTPAIDPDLTPIRYYRIYRDDGASLSSRLTTPTRGASLSWTDDAPNAASHKYWISAVDDHLAESAAGAERGIQP